MATTRGIDKKSQNIFNDYLHEDWLIRKQNPDIYIDYFVEIADGEEPSGITFGVQLKGTTSPRYSKTYLKISFKTKHLIYYLDKVKQPVFIIVVDVKKKQGYWFFAQEWAKNELEIRNWKNQKKIDLKIPLSNSLVDSKNFRSEIARSEIYMRELWPSSIPAAVQYAKQSLEKLDPRIEIDVSYLSNRANYHLKAKEPIDFKIQFKGEEHIIQQFKDLRDFGETATINTEEIIQVEGSQLLEAILKRTGKLLIEPVRKVHTTLIFSTLDKEKQESTTLYGVEGLMRGGQKRVQFEGGLKDTPLNIQFSFPLPISEGNKRLTVNFDFNASQWERIPIGTLPYFENLKNFFTSIHNGCGSKIICETKGNHLFTVSSPNTIDQNFMELTYAYLSLLDKVRFIAKETQINFLLPEKGSIGKDELETILLLYQLIKHGEHRQNGSHARFKFNLIPSEVFFNEFSNLDDGILGDFAFDPQDKEFCLFGEKFSIGQLRYTLTKSRIITDLSEIMKRREEIKKIGIEIEWEGLADSELIISTL